MICPFEALNQSNYAIRRGCWFFKNSKYDNNMQLICFEYEVNRPSNMPRSPQSTTPEGLSGPFSSLFFLESLLPAWGRGSPELSLQPKSGKNMTAI